MKLNAIFLTIALAAGLSSAAFAEDKPMAGMAHASMGAMDGVMGEVMPDPAKMAEGVKLGDLVLYDAFTRAMPPTARAGGGFVTIVNTGKEDDRLVSAASEVAAFVQLHTMTMDNGVMVMREMENGIDIPAGKAIALKPGGLHIMFIDATKPFAEGEMVDVTLTFEKAGVITITLPVGALGSTDMPMKKN